MLDLSMVLWTGNTVREGLRVANGEKANQTAHFVQKILSKDSIMTAP